MPRGIYTRKNGKTGTPSTTEKSAVRKVARKTMARTTPRQFLERGSMHQQAQIARLEGENRRLRDLLKSVL